jgi:hypothetical protein
MATPNPRVPRSNPGTPATPSSASRSNLSAIKEAARKKKRENSQNVSLNSPNSSIHDPFAAAIAAKDLVRGQTGLVFDEKMAEHSNPWDANHIERPERLLRAKERCEELGLVEKCLRIPSRKATLEELQMVHSQDYLEQLQRK